MISDDQLRARVRDAIDLHLRATPHAGQPLRGQEPVADDSKLSALLIDDLDRLEITMAVEEACDVELDYDLVAELQTVAQLADHVAERLYPAVAA